MRRIILALAALSLVAPALPADVLLLKDGKRLEGDVTDKGATYEVKTPYGNLSVDKADVSKIVKSPAQLSAEGETYQKIARGMYDDALKVENDPKERNRKLTAGLELLEKALKIYNEAREIFPGPEGAPLDKAVTTVVQEMRLYRDKMSTDQPAAPAPPKPEPATVPPAAPPKPTPAPPVAAVPATLEPVTPPSVAPAKPPPPVSPDASAGRPAPEAASKPAKELVADLASADASVRAAAAEQLGKTKPADAASSLAEAFRKEADATARMALVAALGAYDGTVLAKLPAISDAAAKGTDDHKKALVALFKKAGTEPGVRFLVDQFVARGEMGLRNEIASALKKHKKLAVKPLIECCKKYGGKPDIQMDVIKYLGLIEESRQGAPFLVALLEPDASRNVVLHAIFKIDRPAVPALIGGLSGANHTRIYSAWILRSMTDLMLTSQKVDEWNRWWLSNKRAIDAEEANQEKEDEAADWPVTNADWSEYDTQISITSGTWIRGRGRGRLGGG
jgi:hypothetical protein